MAEGRGWRGGESDTRGKGREIGVVLEVGEEREGEGREGWSACC